MPRTAIRPTLAAAAAFVALGWSGAAAAGHPACPAPGTAAEVRLERIDGGLSYDLTKSSGEIARLPGSAVHPSQAARGLTATNFRSGVSVAFARVAVPGGVCLTPRLVEAQVGYDPTVIYVENKYPRGSCQYEVILAHERLHVRNKDRTLDAHLPRIRAALEAAVASAAFPVFAPDYEMAKRMAMGEIAGPFQAAVAALSQDRERLDAALDSPGNYAATQALCAEW